MRSNHIHTLFTRYVDPSIPVQTAKRVNHVMDNPSASDKAFRRLFPTTPQYPRVKGQRRNNGFGVKKIGHRVYNHDWHDAVIRGWIEGGADGAKAGVLHLVGDMVRDVFVQSTGVKNANLGEALLEYFLTNKK